ncbi:MAG: isoprenyl transferase [Chitinophagales bacterium]|jgi:undecaprenyl diphosphate synthase|nr:isoprenyl transferase [Chitinophagales bacterium]
MPDSIFPVIDPQRLPRHIAVIMDGNGRWAKARGKNRVFGHTEGVKAVKRITEACAKWGIEYLTLYTFSTENWGRPSLEVQALMELLVHSIRKEVDELSEKGVRLRTIGDMAALPKRCQEELTSGIIQTQHNHRLTLTLALSYGSRWELTEAMRSIARDIADGSIDPHAVSEALISSRLQTADMPDPELLIRTSGELRISNYLLWQIAYSELYFTDQYWPDFDENALLKAIAAYQQRSRRMGKIS